MFQFFFCFLDQANEWRPRCERICSNLSYIKTSPSSTHTGSFAILQRILQWKRRPFYERRNSCLNKEFFMIREKCNIAIILVHLNRAGEINSRLSNDVQEFKSAFKHCISQGLRCSAQVNIETPRRGLCVFLLTSYEPCNRMSWTIRWLLKFRSLAVWFVAVILVKQISVFIKQSQIRNLPLWERR